MRVENTHSCGRKVAVSKAVILALLRAPFRITMREAVSSLTFFFLWDQSYFFVRTQYKEYYAKR